MSKLARFVATCLLVVSLSAVVLADGGQTQGTGFTSPAPPTECSLGSVKTVTPVVRQDSLADLATVVTVSLTLLAEVIF
jgi:hypothetical protein